MIGAASLPRSARWRLDHDWRIRTRKFKNKPAPLPLRLRGQSFAIYSSGRPQPHLRNDRKHGGSHLGCGSPCASSCGRTGETWRDVTWAAGLPALSGETWRDVTWAAGLPARRPAEGPGKPGAGGTSLGLRVSLRVALRNDRKPGWTPLRNNATTQSNRQHGVVAQAVNPFC